MNSLLMHIMIIDIPLITQCVSRGPVDYGSRLCLNSCMSTEVVCKCSVLWNLKVFDKFPFILKLEDVCDINQYVGVQKWLYKQLQ